MDVARYGQAIAECFPQIAIRTCEPILEGWDSLVLEVNSELIFRFPRRPEIEPALTKEIALLPELAKALPVAVPRFEFIWGGGAGYNRPFVGYRKIPGVALTRETLAPAQAGRLAQQLATFLTALHCFPVERAVQLKVPPSDAQKWRQEYLDLYAWIHEQVFPLLETTVRSKIAALWSGFLLDEANFRFQPALTHHDLGGEHILHDPQRGTITGVIDWGDAAIGDPALDFVGLLRDLGQDFAEQVLSAYQGRVDSTFRTRMAFYSQICPVYEIQFGLTTADEGHLQHGLEELRQMSGR